MKVSVSLAGIAIGTRLANSLNVSVGSEVTVLARTASRGASAPLRHRAAREALSDPAIFEMGMSEYDNTDRLHAV